MNIKYVAAGFSNDAKKLIIDFFKEKTVDFLVFARIWKKHNFSSIFSGRDEKEIVVFTQEIFQLTVKFLDKTSFFYQAACIFLLYSLFQCQTNFPPVRIRLSLPQLKIVKTVLDTSVKNHQKHLSYIIEFLIKNGFDFTASDTLLGPRTSTSNRAKYKPDIPTLIVDGAKKELNELLDSKVLEELRDFSKYYSALKEEAYISKADSTTKTFPDEFNKLNNQLKTVVGITDNNQAVNIQETSGIGLRRTRLKELAFQKKTQYRQQTKTDDSDEDVDGNISIAKKPPKRKRARRHTPRSERKIGRPSKADLAARMNIKSESSEDEIPEVKRKKRGPVGKPKYFTEDGSSPPGTWKSKLVKLEEMDHLYEIDSSEE